MGLSDVKAACHALPAAAPRQAYVSSNAYDRFPLFTALRLMGDDFITSLRI